MSRAARERRRVVAVEAVGPYALVRVDRGRHRSRRPRSVLHARGARPRAAAADVALPRAARRARVPARPDRPGHARTRGARAGRRARTSSVRSATAFDSTCARPLLVGGGIGVAPLPYLSEALEHPPAVLGFRSDAPRRSGSAGAERRGRDRPRARHGGAAGRARRARMRARADARSGARARPGGAARMGGADGLRLRRVLRLRRRDRRRAEATVRRRTGAVRPPERERLPRRADGAATSRRRSTRS